MTIDRSSGFRSASCVKCIWSKTIRQHSGCALVFCIYIPLLSMCLSKSRGIEEPWQDRELRAGTDQEELLQRVGECRKLRHSPVRVHHGNERGVRARVLHRYVSSSPSIRSGQGYRRCQIQRHTIPAIANRSGHPAFFDWRGVGCSTSLREAGDGLRPVQSVFRDRPRVRSWTARLRPITRQRLLCEEGMDGTAYVLAVEGHMDPVGLFMTANACHGALNHAWVNPVRR